MTLIQQAKPEMTEEEILADRALKQERQNRRIIHLLRNMSEDSLNYLDGSVICKSECPSKLDILSRLAITSPFSHKVIRDQRTADSAFDLLYLSNRKHTHVPLLSEDGTRALQALADQVDYCWYDPSALEDMNVCDKKGKFMSDVMNRFRPCQRLVANIELLRSHTDQKELALWAESDTPETVAKDLPFKEDLHLARHRLAAGGQPNMLLSDLDPSLTRNEKDLLSPANAIHNASLMALNTNHKDFETLFDSLGEAGHLLLSDTRVQVSRSSALRCADRLWKSLNRSMQNNASRHFSKTYIESVKKITGKQPEGDFASPLFDALTQATRELESSPLAASAWKNVHQCLSVANTDLYRDPGLGSMLWSDDVVLRHARARLQENHPGEWGDGPDSLPKVIRPVHHQRQQQHWGNARNEDLDWTQV